MRSESQPPLDRRGLRGGKFRGACRQLFQRGLVVQLASLQQATELPGDGAANDDFGISVAISGNVAIVGAVFDDDNGVSSGSAYLFDVTTGQQLHKLLPDDGLAGDWFGIHVSISGNRAMVGAERKDGAMNEAGAAYVFDVATGNQVTKLVAGDAAHLDRLGSAVAISGTTAVAGAYGGDPPSGAFSDQGSAYLFDLSRPGVWCNVGGGTLGSSGQPTLSMSGTLAPASLTTLDLVDANPSATTLLFGAFASTPRPSSVACSIRGRRAHRSSSSRVRSEH